MSKKYWIVLLFVMVSAFINPPRVQAEVQCPWLNAATAAGVLGGEVQASVTALTSQGDTTCAFKRTDHTTVFAMTIAVHTMALPSKDFATFLAQCTGMAVPLKAVGNEAIQCVPRNNSYNGEEQIIGRVRDRAFIIDMKRSSAKQSASIQSVLSEETRNVAEQVAGALF